MSEIKHVSDTALWVAYFRAKESDRPDGAFKDPLARKLVGERGREIAEQMPYGKILEWVMVLRTVAIDRLILKAIELGADAVVNLGAGLDTRPYRMKLPENLPWVEVDFPHMIDYKNKTLSQDTPVCKLERLAVDLSNDEARRDLFKNLGTRFEKILVITEGVIPYLTNGQAAGLARDLHLVPSFSYWIQDYRQGGVRMVVATALGRALKEAPFKFTATDWLGFFENLGWVTKEKISTAEEARNLRRPFPFIFPWSLLYALAPKALQQKMQARSGYVLLGRK